MSLPIWRDKIEAEIKAAQAKERAAEARLSEEKLKLAVEFAVMSLMYRESDRELRTLEKELLPRAKSSLEVARSGYIGGQSSFVDFLEAERSLLRFELARSEARKNREIALTNLTLTIAGVVPLRGMEDTETLGGAK
jgi:outer membrane protein TolC